MGLSRSAASIMPWHSPSRISCVASDPSAPTGHLPMLRIGRKGKSELPRAHRPQSKRRDDRLHDALGLVHDVAVPESEDAVTLRPQESVAVCIVRCLVEILTAVEFDDDSHLGADEVADVGADHVLAPELEAAHLTATKPAPEKAFGRCQILAQVSGKVEHGRRRAYRHGLNMT